MFTNAAATSHEAVAPGIRRKTMTWGDRTLTAEFLLRAGSVLPMHAHPHEQTGYLVAGHMLLTIGAERHEVRPGDSWCVPGGVVHGADVLEDSVAVEVFSPPREDYLPGG